MKNSSLLIRTAIIVAITLVGVYLVFGPRGSITANDFTWSGIKNSLANNINLGLDLKGGSHLVMRVKTEEYLKKLTEDSRDAALKAAQDAKLPVGDAASVAENNNYQVTLNVADPSKAQEIVDEVRKKVGFDPNVWTESNNGNNITWSLSRQSQAKLKEQATDQALKIIESRINAFGVKEPTLQRQGKADSGQILLQMPGVENPERVKKLVGENFTA